jgi:ACS family tartrate transporter-like MFS transporter
MPDANIAQRARRRIFRRLIPFLFLLYVINYLDRVNVAYAALSMTHDLGFSDRVFGFGAGIFFAGYLLLEIPGALIVERWSARKWIARIMISWGLVTVAVAMVNTPREFYGARFLLGTAEAGFFPGIMVYLRHWFRVEDRAKAAALFMAAIPLSSIVGSPLAGVLLGVHWFGLAGWRWLFIVEGIPAVIFGVLTLVWLTDRPQDARWLPEDERRWIIAELEREAAAHRPVTVLEAFRHPQVLLISLAWFVKLVGMYGLLFWLPTLLKRASGLPNLTVTLIVIIPYLVALFAMIANGWHSDRTGERRWHGAVPLLIAATSFGVLAGQGSSLPLALTVALFAIVAAGGFSYDPPFWASAGSVLSGAAGAAALGFINCIGSIGGFVGPYAVGFLNTRTGSSSAGLAFLTASFYFGALLLLFVRPASHKPAAP